MLFEKSLLNHLESANITDWKIVHKKELSSTNDFARELLATNENVVVLADVQTQGRGTHGRIWESPEGGIWMSVATKIPLPIEEYSSIIAQRLASLISDIIDYDCYHKPVNDIMADGKKLAGILVETKIVGEKIIEMVVGVGINVMNKIPDYLREIAISVSDLLIHRSVIPFAVDIAEEIIYILRDYQRKII